MPHLQAREKVSLAELASTVRQAPRDAWPRLTRRLQADSRAGALRLLSQLEARKAAYLREHKRLGERLRFEKTLWQRGIDAIAGVDEVGVGPLAGPVVAAAVILPARLTNSSIGWLWGLDDSKRLRPIVRQRLVAQIYEHAVAVGVGLVAVEELDAVGIGFASKMAMQRAIEALDVAPAHLLIDARALDGVACPQTSIIGGDGLSLSIAAASVVAKEYRDALMVKLAAEHPGYGFEVHAGYGTKAHLAALERLGPSAEHRRSFAPVARALQLRQTKF